MKKKILKYVCEHWITTNEMEQCVLRWTALGAKFDCFNMKIESLQQENEKLNQSLTSLQTSVKQCTCNSNETKEKKTCRKSKKNEIKK